MKINSVNHSPTHGGNGAGKTGSAYVLCLLLLSALVACSAEDNADEGNLVGSTTTLSAEETAAPDDPYAARMLVSANLPKELNFNGAHLRTMVNSSKDNVMTSDIYLEKETGDVVDDAIYRRRVYVEELLNIVFDPSVAMEVSDASSAIRRTVNAGDDAYDLYLEHMIQAGSDTLTGIFLDWYDIPHMNFTNPWYPQDSIESMTVDGTMYLLLSDVMRSALHNTYCYYFNKEIAANYDLPDIYELVRSGTWTIDKVTELSKDVYQDLNGNGQHDEEDRYGYATSIDSNVVTYFWAFDVPLVDVSGD
ncbi:MAG: hypothetical protein ACI3XM_04115, partial [Eubacteriales bacterium]